MDEARPSWVVSDDGWIEYRRLVLSELTRLNENILNLGMKVDSLNSQRLESISHLYVAVAMLQVKAGVWGLLGGFVPVILAILIGLLTKKL